MAAPFIQIGQCGNQVGRKFYQIMFQQGLKSSNGHQALLQSFFTNDDIKNIKAKAFSIDMQPKVVDRNLKIKDKWSYDQKLSLVQQQGSGNNWAFGCHIHGPKNQQKLLQLFNKFAQKQDYIKCFIQTQSMAGGTGSGLGTYIIQLLNQQFNKIPKFITCIMPHLSGQVILQSYNTCLSLASIYSQADGIFLIQNDQISQICKKNLNLQKISLDDINQVIGRQLASIYFPAIHKNTEKVFSIEQNGIDYSNDLIQNVFWDPSYKLASIKTVPHGPKNYQSFNSDTWQSLQNDLTYRRKLKSKSQMIIIRGPDHPSTNIKNFPTIFDKHRFYNYNKSLTLIDNNKQFIDPLQKILIRGYNMLKQNSYIYQYQKYGINSDQIINCFANIQNILMYYSKL